MDAIIRLTSWCCSVATSSAASPTIQLPFPYYTNQHGMPTGKPVSEPITKFHDVILPLFVRGASRFIRIRKLWAGAVSLDSGEAVVLGSTFLPLP